MPKIVDYAEYGEHIPLKCKNHPNLRWSTKNIDRIGMRSIFYQSPMEAPECNCPVSDLVPLTEEEMKKEQEQQ